MGIVVGGNAMCPLRRDLDVARSWSGESQGVE